MFSFAIGVIAAYLATGIYVAALMRKSALKWAPTQANAKQFGKDVIAWPITVEQAIDYPGPTKGRPPGHSPGGCR
jgi:hypothetical protein